MRDSELIMLQRCMYLTANEIILSFQDSPSGPADRKYMQLAGARSPGYAYATGLFSRIHHATIPKLCRCQYQQS